MATITEVELIEKIIRATIHLETAIAQENETKPRPFHEIFCELRIYCNISIAQLASQLELSSGNLSTMHSGKRPPSLKVLIKLYKFFKSRNVPLLKLIELVFSALQTDVPLLIDEETIKAALSELSINE